MARRSFGKCWYCGYKAIAMQRWVIWQKPVCDRHLNKPKQIKKVKK